MAAILARSCQSQRGALHALQKLLFASLSPQAQGQPVQAPLHEPEPPAVTAMWLMQAFPNFFQVLSDVLLRQDKEDPVQALGPDII